MLSKRKREKRLIDKFEPAEMKGSQESRQVYYTILLGQLVLREAAEQRYQNSNVPTTTHACMYAKKKKKTLI